MAQFVPNMQIPPFNGAPKFWADIVLNIGPILQGANNGAEQSFTIQGITPAMLLIVFFPDVANVTWLCLRTRVATVNTAIFYLANLSNAGGTITPGNTRCVILGL